MDEIDLTQNSASAPVLRMHAQQNKRTVHLQQRTATPCQLSGGAPKHAFMHYFTPPQYRRKILFSTKHLMIYLQSLTTIMPTNNICCVFSNSHNTKEKKILLKQYNKKHSQIQNNNAKEN
jgi:hypothetical protein